MNNEQYTRLKDALVRFVQQGPHEQIERLEMILISLAPLLPAARVEELIDELDQFTRRPNP